MLKVLCFIKLKNGINLITFCELISIKKPKMTELLGKNGRKRRKLQNGVNDQLVAAY